MKPDPDLTQLYAATRRASEELVKRLEVYEELVPARANEAAVADEVVEFTRFAERVGTFVGDGLAAAEAQPPAVGPGETGSAGTAGGS